MSEKSINQISILSVVLILFISLLLFFYVLHCKRNNNLKKKQRSIEQIPSMLSTLGVLGTFVGITIGLWFFNPQDLEKSVPFLLEGLKTAFFTSLAGMVTSLFFSKWINGTFDKYLANNPTNQDEAAEKICTAIVQSENNQKNFYEQAIAIFSTLNTNIKTLTDTSKQLLQDFNDHNNKQLKIVQHKDKSNTDLFANSNEMLESVSQQVSIMQETLERSQKSDVIMRGYIDEIESEMRNTNSLLALKFDEFSTLLRESNTKSLVEVMKNVTTEFQKQMSDLINRLVQENFKELNNSVQKLNEWQQENKNMVDSLIRNYHEMEIEFKDTSNTLTNVSKQAHQLVGDGGKLSQLVAVLNEIMINDEKFATISKHLENTAILAENNMASFDKSTTKLAEWIDKTKGFTNDVQKLINKLDELNKIRDYGQQFWEQTRKQMNEGIGILHAGSNTLNEQLKNLDERFYTRLSITLSELDKLMTSMANKYLK